MAIFQLAIFALSHRSLPARSDRPFEAGRPGPGIHATRRKMTLPRRRLAALLAALLRPAPRSRDHLFEPKKAAPVLAGPFLNSSHRCKSRPERNGSRKRPRTG